MWILYSLWPKFSDEEEKEWIMKRWLVVISIILLSSGHAIAQSKENTAVAAKGSPPVLKDVWSPETLKPGAVWRIYLEAEDPDGDMKDIATEISSPVSSLLDISNYYFTQIKEEQRDSVKGYIFTRTALNLRLIGERFKLKLAVRDENDTKSEVVEVILKFSRKGGEELPQKWQDAADNKLGGIYPDYFIEVSRKMDAPTRP